MKHLMNHNIRQKQVDGIPDEEKTFEKRYMEGGQIWILKVLF